MSAKTWVVYIFTRGIVAYVLFVLVATALGR